MYFSKLCVVYSIRCIFQNYVLWNFEITSLARLWQSTLWRSSINQIETLSRAIMSPKTKASFHPRATNILFCQAQYLRAICCVPASVSSNHQMVVCRVWSSSMQLLLGSWKLLPFPSLSVLHFIYFHYLIKDVQFFIFPSSIAVDI